MSIEHHNYQCPSQLPEAIFRRYDIRGRIGEQLNPETYYALGLTLATYARRKGEQSIVVGRDGRHQSPDYAKALISGLQQCGMHVLDIGLVPTPLLYFATHHTDIRSGLMITGSHNPKDYNGLKMVIQGKTLAAGEIQTLHQVFNAGNFIDAQGSYDTLDIIPAYVDYIAQDIQLKRTLSVVLDAGNGTAGVVAQQLFERLGCQVNTLYCDIDGDFPNHHPDPSVANNLNDIIARVKELNADCGLAFDGDADRIGVVTDAGDIVWPDQQMMFYAQSILKKHPKESIVFDVKCSKHLGEWIKQHGGQPIMWQTGHSVLKKKMLEEQSPLAGELSGHIFFNDDRWFGFDDGLYAGARWLEIMSESSKAQSEIIQQLPQAYATPEIKVPLAESEKEKVIEALKQHRFDNATVITLDGIRVEYSDGWALVRMSHTTPCLTVRFEANSKTALDRIQSIFRTLLHHHLPQATLDF